MKLRHLVWVLSVAGASGLLWAQADRGTIEGIVGDGTGAAVPEAQVRILRIETNDAIQLVTNQAGRYFAPNLPMGTYRVEVEKQGFRTARSEPVILRSQTSVRADFSLEVGAVSERIEVSSQAPMVDASSATMTASITTSYINELPMINVGRRRQIFAYLKFLPGVSSPSGNPRVDGSKAGTSETFVDGAPVSAQPNQQGGYRENDVAVEHVGEFNVVTNAFSAEYGRTGTWFANLTVRSGTNSLHGSAFDYFGNDKLNARGFFPATRPVQHQNEAGFTLGAPVFLPKIYNGRNRTFFFFGQQMFYRRGSGAGNLLTIPREDFRGGDFSGFRDNAGAVIPAFDPATQRPDGRGSFVRDQFPANRIPASRISPISQKMMALMPKPDLPAAQSQNYYNRTGVDPKYDSYVSTAKIDHGFSDRQKVAVTYSEHYNPWIIAGRGWGRTSALEGAQDPKQIHSRTGRVNHDYIIRPTLLNHITLGVDRYENTTATQDVGAGWEGKLGLRGLPYPNGAFPYVSFGGGTAAPLALSNRDYSMRGFGRYSFTQNLTWVRGRHSMKFGLNYLREYNNLFEGRDSHGNFSFSNSQTSQPNAGSNFSRWGSATASFLLGELSSGATRSPFTAGFRWRFWSWFAQDEWRLTGKFTLSYGLRWEYSPAGFEKFNRTSTFDPAVRNPGAGGLRGATVFAGNCNGCLGRRNSVESWSRGFAPRLGLAYALNEKTVVRAASGIYYSVSRFAPGTDGHVVTPSFGSPDGYTPAFNWESGFPQNFIRPPVIDPAILNDQSTGYLSPGATRLPQTLTWTFSLQRQLAASLALEVNYIGSHSTHLHDGDPGDTINDIFGFPNVVRREYLSLGNTLLQSITSSAAGAAGVRAPFAGFERFRNNTVAQALKPFPQYVNIRGGDAVGIARYNGLHVKLIKRQSNGLTMLAFYTWTKNMTNAEGGTFQYPLDPGAEVSVSSDGPPHVLVTSLAYELPFGPGKAFLSGSRVLGRVLGGWEISGYFRRASGSALTMTVGNNLSALGYTGKRASYLAGQPVHLLSNPRDFDPARDRFLNANAFAIPGSFEFGNTARVLNWARGWTGKSESISLRKRIPIGERVSLVVRADSDNPFNFVRWSDPNTTRSDANFGRVTGASSGRVVQVNMALEF